MSKTSDRDTAANTRLRAERMEETRKRALLIKLSNPDMPGHVIAERLGVPRNRVNGWLLAAGLSTRPRARWP